MIELPASRVAQLGYDGLMRGRRVVVAGIGNKIAVSLMRFIPNALLMAAVDRRMGSAGTANDARLWRAVCLPVLETR